MTNERYKKIQYMIRSLNHHMQICDELHDEETTQRQNFGQHMEDESTTCHENEACLMLAMDYIESAITELKQIDP